MIDARFPRTPVLFSTIGRINPPNWEDREDRGAGFRGSKNKGLGGNLGGWEDREDFGEVIHIRKSPKGHESHVSHMRYLEIILPILPKGSQTLVSKGISDGLDHPIFLPDFCLSSQASQIQSNEKQQVV